MKKNVRFKASPAMKKFSRVFSGVFALAALGFVIVGVTEVIPSGAGVFGVVWTLLACAFLVVGLYGVFSKDGFYSLYAGWGVEIEDETPGGEEAGERLKKLQALYDQRLITTEEYEEKREEILKDL